MTTMKTVAAVLLGLLAGPIVAWMLAYCLYYYPQQEEVHWDGLPAILISSVGAFVGAIAGIVGRHPVPLVVKHASLGALRGAGLVVITTWILAGVCGGPSGKGQARYYDWGLNYALVPALVVGSIAGVVLARRRQDRERIRQAEVRDKAAPYERKSMPAWAVPDPREIPLPSCRTDLVRPRPARTGVGQPLYIGTWPAQRLNAPVPDVRPKVGFRWPSAHVGSPPASRCWRLSRL
jgi:hypothetical protein